MIMIVTVVVAAAAAPPGLGGAWLAVFGAAVVALIGGVLTRRPRRSVAFDEMQSAIETQGKLLDRQEKRIVALEADVEACHSQRDADRRRFTEELVAIRGLLRREGDPDA